MVLVLFPPPTLPIAERIGTPTAVLQEQDRGETGLIHQKVSVCRGTQQTLICSAGDLKAPGLPTRRSPVGRYRRILPGYFRTITDPALQRNMTRMRASRFGGLPKNAARWGLERISSSIGSVAVAGLRLRI